MRYDRRKRISMARAGQAIPITNDDGEILDGSFPIADAEDLDAAIGSLNHHPNKKRAKTHIVARAAAIGQSSRLPKTWTPKKRPRGRPVGSPSLTKEREDTILRLIRRGAFEVTAAGVAGISERTLREWVARGEGRSPRPKTPKLEAFAHRFRTAKAEARAIAEVKAYEDHILQWLKYAARSTTESEGWTALPEGFVGDGTVPMPEQVAELITGIRNDLLYSDRDSVVPPCANRRCRCAFHHPRTAAEQAVLRESGDRLRREPGSAA
jgi:hypothetical protein